MKRSLSRSADAAAARRAGAAAAHAVLAKQRRARATATAAATTTAAAAASVPTATAATTTAWTRDGKDLVIDLSDDSDEDLVIALARGGPVRRGARCAPVHAAEAPTHGETASMAFAATSPLAARAGITEPSLAHGQAATERMAWTGGPGRNGMDRMAQAEETVLAVP